MNDSSESQVFTLKLLGTPSLSAQGAASVPGLGPGKSLAMLAFLAVRGTARRDELISLLWGEIEEDKARNAFRQSLHRLRSSLGDEILPQDRDVVSIGNRTLLRCDRDAFVRACDEQRWLAAVAAYDGDFLEGFEVREPAFDRWADAERIKLRSRLETALRNAANETLEAGQFGEAVKLCERLSAVAPFDEHAAILEATVLVSAGRSEEAARALGRFIDHLQEELELDASPEIRALFTRLQRAESRRTPTSGDPAAMRPAPFVGREAELSRLLAALNDLSAEHGALVVVEGEAGIGKTRLIQEFSSRARRLGGVHLLHGREHSLVSTIPFASLAEALRPLVRAPGVAGTSKHLLAEAARLLPELRDSFELPDVPWVEDDAGRLRFFEGVAALIDGAAYERPVCIALDDVQHASASTLELVAYLAGRLRTSPVLLVVAYRPQDLGAQTAERVRRLAESASEDERYLRLTPLTTAESEQLVRAIVMRGDRLPERVIDRIVHTAGGRPWAVHDLTRRVLSGEAATTAPIPIKEVLWARLQAASPSQRRVFFAASIFERHASTTLLAAAAHLPQPAAADAVAALIAAGLLTESEAGCTIAHDVTASFIHDASGIAGRAMLADWAAEALSHQGDATHAELANLYALAGRTVQAFEHARRGAFDAASMGALPEAMRLLNAALTFAPDEESRSQLESLITAFGQPQLRLAAAAEAYAPASASESDDSTRAHDVDDTGIESPPASAPGPAPHAPQRVGLSHATARQWMTSIALSLLITVLGLTTRRELLARRPSAEPIDSLVLVERGTGDDDSLRIAHGSLGTDPLDLQRIASAGPAPAWVRSLRSPWTNPRMSPDGRYVSVERVTEHGTDVYVVSTNARDTIPIAVGGRDNTVLDWSPDSRFLLVSRARMLPPPDGGFDSDLFACSIDGKHVVPIDTAATRSIVDARWSPAGTLVAWVARLAAGRQQEIYVSAPDGSNMRDVSSNRADDFHPAWSPDGTLLAFTSMRTGARRIFAYDFENARVWPVTDRDGDDRAHFSPNGRYLAFESTRDGDAAIYVSRPLGGSATRITPRGRQFSILDWRGTRPPYVDRVRIVGPANATIGDITQYSLIAIDQYGAPVRDVGAAWRLDPRGPLLPTDSTQSDTSVVRTLVASRLGDANLVSTIAGWRADTLDVSVSPTQPLELRDDFNRGLNAATWLSLGAPLPFIARSAALGASALYPNGDLEWDSGILSRATFELAPGLSVSTRVAAPFGGRPSSATFAFALVPAQSNAAVDHVAPRFSPLLGIGWDGQSGALTYAVGAQSTTDQPSPGSSHTLRIAVGGEGAVTFAVDGAVRWKTSLRYLGEVHGTRVRLWIGGRATDSTIAVGEVDARMRR